MKKLSIFLLLFLSLFALSSKFIVAEDIIDDTFAGARYVIDEVKETNYLPYGVNHVRVHGQTSTSMSGYDADGFGGKDDKVVPGQLYDQQVNVMEVPSDENVRITSWAYLDGHKWTLNTVRSLITDYEAKNPGWKVVGAINGDFFDINGNGNLPYQTSGAVVSNGEFYKTTTGNLVGFRNDGSANSLIGNEKVERTPNMILSIYNNAGEIIKEFDIDKVNQLPGAGESSVFYAVYGADKKIIAREVQSNGYFVGKAELALPNRDNDFYGKGKISSLEAKTISTGEFAIVSNNDEVNQYLNLDVNIRVQYKYIGAYEGVNDISGGGTTIMKNGVDSGSSITDRAPRTVIGRKADGTIIMMVIDGRQSSIGMYGADRTELGAIMKHYGAVEAYNLDGGGSSTMIIRKDGKFEVVNSPSDGRERTDANAILVVVKDPELKIESTATINSIKLNVDIINNNSHDISQLYVNLNGESKLVVNNEVSFENLESNTSYSYSIDYKDSKGDTTRILTSGIIQTYKQTPVFEGIKVIERSDKFEFVTLFTDPDEASGFDKAEMKVDGKLFGYFFNSQKSISKTNLQKFDKITITTIVNIGDGNNQRIVIEITDFEIEKTVDVYIKVIFDTQNNFVTKVYK